MVQANELRIGNLFYPINRSSRVHLPNKVALKIIELKAFDVSAVMANENPALIKNWHNIQYADLSPIPLSPEILEKAGFDKTILSPYTDMPSYRFGKDAERVIFSGGSVFKYTSVNHFIKIADAEYLHQLQNLIYFLTGEELNITL